MLTVGAAMSMTGNNVGQALSGSRELFALAEQGDCRVVRPRPSAVSGRRTSRSSSRRGRAGARAPGRSRRSRATSAVARLLVYAGTCASVLALRRQGRRHLRFRAVRLIPVLALAISIGILFGATELQVKVGLSFLVAGAILYGVAVWRKP